jgi:hypothetical protein
VKKETECNNINEHNGNDAWKGHGAENIKGKITKSTRSVQKTLMQIEQCSVAEKC